MMMRGDEPWIQNGVRLIALDSRSDTSWAFDFQALTPLLSIHSDAVMSPINGNNNLAPSIATGAMTTSCDDGGREIELLPNRQEPYEFIFQPMTPASLRIRGTERHHVIVLFVFGVCSSAPFETSTSLWLFPNILYAHLQTAAHKGRWALTFCKWL